MIKVKLEDKSAKKLHKILQKHKAYSEQTFVMELKKMLAEATARAKKKAPVDTGNLRSSIGYDATSRKTLLYRALAPYASFLEYGTRRQKAQPYFFGSLDRAYDNLLKRIEKALKQLKK